MVVGPEGVHCLLLLCRGCPCGACPVTDTSPGGAGDATGVNPSWFAHTWTAVTVSSRRSVSPGLAPLLTASNIGRVDVSGADAGNVRGNE